MAIFGWITILIITILMTGAYFFICTQTMGKYNIGGRPTTKQGKVVTIIAGILLALWWAKVLEWTPFTITLTS